MKNTTIKNPTKWDQKIPDEPPGSWPDFANNFLNRFFEGQSISIWLFVSGLLIILYGRFASFEKNLIGEGLRCISLLFLLALIISTLCKYLVWSIRWPWGINLRSILNLHKTYI